MIVGLDFASDMDSLEPHRVDIGKIEKLRLFSGVFDELSISNDGDSTYNTNRESWTYSSLIMAKFNGNLNAGNVDFEGLVVSDIVVKRRKIEDLSGWQRVAKTSYDRENIQTYEFYDKSNESHQEYEYALVPVTAQGIEGDYITDTIWSEFEDVFVLDKDKHYRLRYNINRGSTERVTKNALFEPLGSKYPITVSNGATNYNKGSLDTLLVSDKSLLGLNPREEVRHRKTLMDFFSNNKPKIFKDGNGEIYVIKIMDNPSISFVNELQGVLGSVNFNWIEIGENSENDLVRNGLLDKSVVT